MILVSVPVNCPKCDAKIKEGDNMGDWSRFVCHKCNCLFTVANSDLEGPYVPDDVVVLKQPFNPSSRSER